MTKRVHLPWLDWMQKKSMDWIAMRESNREPERTSIIVCVPRGFGKSNIITKSVPLWLHLYEPNLTSYIGSEVHPKAKAFLKPMKAVMEGNDPFSWFSWLYGVFFSPDRDWNSEEVVTAYRKSMGITEPTIGTFGVETGMTSKHPLLCIYDDPVSKEKLKEGGSWLQAVHDSLDSIFPALRPDSMFILIGTRYLENDPIGETLSVEGVKEWVGHAPLEEYKEGLYEVFFLQARDIEDTDRYPKGRPILPESGWNDEALSRYERKKAQEYASQMMNDPSRGEHMELTREQIEALVIPRPKANDFKNRIPFRGATVHLDTAFKDDVKREHGDYNVIEVWLHDLRPNGMVYLDYIWMDNEARSEDFDRELVNVMHMLHRRGIRIIAITDEVEQGGKRGVYRGHIEQLCIGARLRIPEIYQFNRAGTKKDQRIREAAQYWVEGFVRIFEDCPNWKVMRDQMAAIGRTKYRDVADAGADVFRPEVWTGRHGVDQLDAQPPPPVQPGDDVLKGEIGEQMSRIRRGEAAMADLYPDMNVPERDYEPRGPW